jgi:hypothetical protein
MGRTAIRREQCDAYTQYNATIANSYTTCHCWIITSSIAAIAALKMATIEEQWNGFSCVIRVTQQ